MHLEKYELTQGGDAKTFEFWSVGPKGKILKSVQFQPTDQPNVYNLAFGDWNAETMQLNDIITTNNGDSEKVLASVVSAVYLLTSQLQQVWIFATGSTPARTRLYQIGVNKHYELAIADFDIVGRLNNRWEIFQKGKNYDAIAVRRKNFKFEE